MSFGGEIKRYKCICMNYKIFFIVKLIKLTTKSEYKLPIALFSSSNLPPVGSGPGLSRVTGLSFIKSH